MTTPEFTIAHLTDLRPDGGVAFTHAVALATRAAAPLTTLHAATGGPAREMPCVTDLLASWNKPVEALIYDARTHECCDDPIDTLLDGLRRLNPHLIVAGTHQWKGLSRTFRGSVTESVAAQATAPTLVLPIGHPGFVDPDTGDLHLKKIVLPIGDDKEARAAIDATADLLTHLDISDVDLYLLRVGDALPDTVVAPEGPGWRWHTLQAEGDLTQAIIDTCEDVDCDVVAMATRGQDGFLDIFRGTHTERVMRKTSRALLVIPVT